MIKGIRDGKLVEFKAPVVMKDAESGNSFIPRLWARMHLDALLEQGRTPEVKEDVIALSEESTSASQPSRSTFGSGSCL